MTIEVSAELSAEASTPVEAQIEIQLVSEDEEEAEETVAEAESNEPNQRFGDVRVSDFFLENSRNGRSRSDDT